MSDAEKPQTPLRSPVDLVGNSHFHSAGALLAENNTPRIRQIARTLFAHRVDMDCPFALEMNFVKRRGIQSSALQEYGRSAAANRRQRVIGPNVRVGEGFSSKNSVASNAQNGKLALDTPRSTRDPDPWRLLSMQRRHNSIYIIRDVEQPIVGNNAFPVFSYQRRRLGTHPNLLKKNRLIIQHRIYCGGLKECPGIIPVKDF